MGSVLSPRRPDDTVMASIDGDREDERLIIADVSQDEAWIAMDMAAAPSLTHWR